MKWNLRMAAAERGIWKSTELRRMLADAGLEISAGKMSALWTGTPTTIRLDDLDVICEVLDCEPTKLLVREPGNVAALRAAKTATGDQPGAAKPPTPIVQPRLGRNRTRPPE
ncbi:helix-turn-helix transcriptional regulator [Nocardioides sp. 31GB23]|uniref:helix-turn-helix domain-containing protein n=1 Tax=Nocardioides sp. 31GB23 TaxID=3156065 RepID=UPI0032AF4C63